MKSAIVTGSSSGIGLEISKILIDLGYKVFGFGRNFSKINYENVNFIPNAIDFLEKDKLFKRINELKKAEDIYILVNCAGVGYFGPHEELSPKKISEMVQINLEIPMSLTQILLRELKRNTGYIINISSVTAKKSSTHGCAYAATKSGLGHFSDSLFDEVRKHGVRVTTIYPDITKTQFYRNANFLEADNMDTYICSEEIANAVEFILNQRDGLNITDITIKPQKHMIKRKN